MKLLRLFSLQDPSLLALWNAVFSTLSFTHNFPCGSFSVKYTVKFKATWVNMMSKTVIMGLQRRLTMLFINLCDVHYAWLAIPLIYAEQSFLKNNDKMSKTKSFVPNAVAIRYSQNLIMITSIFGKVSHFLATTNA